MKPGCKSAHYLADCQTLVKAQKKHLVVLPSFEGLPGQIPLPKLARLMSVYCQDVLSQVQEVKAEITSVYGCVLKVDSTKKITMLIDLPEKVSCIGKVKSEEDESLFKI